MIVKLSNGTQDLASAPGLQRKSKDFLLPESETAMDRTGGFSGKKVAVVLEDRAADLESVISRRSVERWRRRKDVDEKVGCLHSQVLRIRDEESHLGEDIGEGFSPKDKVVNGGGFGQSLRPRRVASAVNVVLFSRPSVLPCSPLSGRTAAATVKALH